eukprot:974169-Prymnesium_polylepis.1
MTAATSSARERGGMRFTFRNAVGELQCRRRAERPFARAGHRVRFTLPSDKRTLIRITKGSFRKRGTMRTRNGFVLGCDFGSLVHMPHGMDTDTDPHQKLAAAPRGAGIG